VGVRGKGIAPRRERWSRHEALLTPLHHIPRAPPCCRKSIPGSGWPDRAYRSVQYQIWISIELDFGAQKKIATVVGGEEPRALSVG
jgi:hypothetical protein